MYAIIRAGGHQEKVTVGETIVVDHLKQDPESTVDFVPLLVSADDGTVVTDRKALADTASVTGRVVAHIKGDKIDVFQYRNKTGYRRHIGHRSQLTQVEISEIRLGDKKMTLDDAKVVTEAAAAKRAEEIKATADAKAAVKEERIKAKTAKKTAASAKTAKAPAKKAPAKKKAAAKK